MSYKICLSIRKWWIWFIVYDKIASIIHMVDSITLVKIHTQPQKFWDFKKLLLQQILR